MSKRVIALTVFVLLLLVHLSFNAAAAKADAAYTPPKSVVLGGAATTSSAYAEAVAITSGITKATGVKFFITPSDTALGRGKLLKNKNVSLVLATSVEIYLGLTGTLDFADLGKQNLRVAWVGGPIAQGAAARANSGIVKPSDIKGKKVAFYASYPLVQTYVDAFLAYANVVPDDVVKVPVGGYGPGMQALLDGAVDVAIVSAQSGKAKEIAASAGGIQWLEMPASDTQGWDRFHNIRPSFFPLKVTSGGGITAESPKHLWGWNKHIWGYEWTDADFVHWFVKHMAEDYGLYKDTLAQLSAWNIDHALDLNVIFAPYHEGAIRYFKEIGKWTPEHEKKQKALIEKYK